MVKLTRSPKPFRNFVCRSMCLGFFRPLSSHAVSDLEPLATRVAVLRAGELVACESVDEMRTRAGLRGRLEDAVVGLLEPKDTAA